jgi:hypothetical protein
MNTAHRTVGYLVVAEFLGLLGFVLLGQYESGSALRFLPVLIAIVAIRFIAYVKTTADSYKVLAYISIMAAVIFVALVQLLGRSAFPGLVKDVGLFSLENAGRVGAMLVIGIGGHFLLLSLARVVRASLRSSRADGVL